MAQYIAAIDQGTTSSRCIVFDAKGEICATAQKEHKQIFPKPGWVEHDGMEIWNNVETVVKQALKSLKIKPADLAAVGVTNQRETTLLWDKATGEPIHNAIVWQDTRTDRLVKKIGGEKGQDRFRKKCGLPLATYFAGPKIRWLLDEVKGAGRKRAEKGEVLCGTMETWIIWKLTGRHVTDVTNASRTMLMNLKTLDWDDELLDAIGVPRAMLPEIRSCSEVYGEATRRPEAGVKVAGALGDQQAALFGQTCFDEGRGQVHLRHRRVFAPEYWGRSRSGPRTASSPPSATRSAKISRSMRWKAPSPSPDRWCSGSATMSGWWRTRRTSRRWPRR